MLVTGTTIAGFRIDGLLGHGGMGIVYRATQLSLQRVMALKLVSPELSRDPGFRARFRREGVIQRALDHPNIVPVYEAGDSEDGLYIAMRLVPGSSLKQLILAQELDAMRTLQVLAGAASGLDAAHAAGLIHRDIKPHNILVVGNQGYLADFGLSKARGLESITKESGWIGTLDYMAPEQIRGDRPDASSDLYSLGAVLYECLVGWVPFPRSSEIAVMYAHLESPPPSVRDTRPELPVQLDDVVARAMAKKPESRQATATELIREATEALGGLAHAAELPPPPPRPARAREESSATGQTTAPVARTAGGGAGAAAPAGGVAVLGADRGPWPPEAPPSGPGDGRCGPRPGGGGRGVPGRSFGGARGRPDANAERRRAVRADTRRLADDPGAAPGPGPALAAGGRGRPAGRSRRRRGDRPHSRVRARPAAGDLPSLGGSFASRRSRAPSARG